MRHPLLAAAIFGTACVCASSSAYAQRGAGFGYGPGIGGAYGNYMVPGYPYYGNGKPSFYYGQGYKGQGNFNNNNQNQRSYAPRTVVVQPQVRRADALPIKVLNPAGAQSAVNYYLNGWPYTIQPGESQLLTNDRKWVISFDRGDSFGDAEYSMSPGTYEFELTDHGWEVYHDADVNKLQRPSDGTGSAENSIPSRVPQK